MIKLCTPALMYFAFSIIQIIIDVYFGMINTAMVKFFTMILLTTLLNVLCANDMGIISWIIVFIPFLFMTVIVTILLFVFRLDPSTGTIQSYPTQSYSSVTNNSTSNNGTDTDLSKSSDPQFD
jgi:ABC-type Na+ efflux pump permease subunit